MGVKSSREELAEYAAHNDVHSLTGLFIVGVAPTPSGLTATNMGLAPTSDVWGVDNWGAEDKDAVQFVIDMNMPAVSPFLNDLQARATNIKNGVNVNQANFYNDVAGMLHLLPGHFTYNTANNTVTDDRHSRLIKRMDLTEWIEIPNSDILYYVLTEAEGERHQTPLGQVTVWVKGGSQVRHVRSKTAKTFVRGEIAQRLNTQDFDPDLEGILRAFFDVDAEDAFSSNLGAC